MNAPTSSAYSGAVPRIVGSSFSKEDYDVSRVFLAYLTFLGNPTKVGIALDMQPEVVEVLAAKEDWATKLKVYLGLRHEEVLAEPDASIRRTATYIAACQLREVIQRLTDHIYRLVDHDNLLEWFLPLDPRTNRPRFNLKILFDLCRAFNVVTCILNRERSVGEDDPAGAREKERVTIRQASPGEPCPRWTSFPESTLLPSRETAWKSGVPNRRKHPATIT